MNAPIAWLPSCFAVEFLGLERFITAYEWTNNRDKNITPVLHARFALEDGSEIDAYAKPFSPHDEHDATVALNEVTGWLLARACGLPVPERAFFAVLSLQELPPYVQNKHTRPLPVADGDGHILCFATQDAGISAVRPAFATEQLLAEQTKWPHCNHTIAFDEAIANPDRHIGNLFRRRAHDFVLIDHGFLLRNSSNFPQHWQPGVLASMLNQAFANLLHYNTYISTSRTAPTVCEPACRECEEFVAKMQPQVRQALFEIAFWCNKLLPGRSAQWLNFLYSRTRQPLLSALLHKRFGLLDLTHART